MNKKWVIAGIVVFFLVVACGSYVSSYNRLLIAEENVDISWAQLETVLEQGNENLIAAEARRYNDAVRQYNTLLQRFPTSMMARIMSFEPRQPFKAADRAKAVPNADF